MKMFFFAIAELVLFLAVWSVMGSLLDYFNTSRPWTAFWGAIVASSYFRITDIIGDKL